MFTCSNRLESNKWDLHWQKKSRNEEHTIGYERLKIKISNKVRRCRIDRVKYLMARITLNQILISRQWLTTKQALSNKNSTRLRERGLNKRCHLSYFKPLISHNKVSYVTSETRTGAIQDFPQDHYWLKIQRNKATASTYICTLC